MCQLPPEAGHPPYIAAGLKKPAYGMNDAPPRRFDKVLCSYGMVPTRADRCCYVLHSRVNEPGTKLTLQWHNTDNISFKPRVTTEADDAFEKMQLQERPW